MGHCCQVWSLDDSWPASSVPTRHRACGLARAPPTGCSGPTGRIGGRGRVPAIRIVGSDVGHRGSLLAGCRRTVARVFRPRRPVRASDLLAPASRPSPQYAATAGHRPSNSTTWSGLAACWLRLKARGRSGWASSSRAIRSASRVSDLPGGGCGRAPRSDWGRHRARPGHG